MLMLSNLTTNEWPFKKHQKLITYIFYGVLLPYDNPKKTMRWKVIPSGNYNLLVFEHKARSREVHKGKQQLKDE